MNLELIALGFRVFFLTFAPSLRDDDRTLGSQEDSWSGLSSVR